MKDEKLVKMFNLTLKKRHTILFYLIVVINGLIWIDSDIELNTFDYSTWWLALIPNVTDPWGKYLISNINAHSMLSCLAKKF